MKPDAPDDAKGGHNRPPLTYKEAGVDIDAGDDLVEHIKPLAKSTDRKGVMGGLGGFGAAYWPASTALATGTVAEAMVCGVQPGASRQ